MQLVSSVNIHQPGISRFLKMIPILLLLCACNTLADPNIIKIQGETDLGWNEADVAYNISKCNPTVPNAPGGQVRTMTTTGKCYNIYREENCTGSFVRMSINKLAVTMFSPMANRWIGDQLISDNLRVGSVGPCFDECDLANWAGDRMETRAVTLYVNNLYQGDSISLVTDEDDCVPIPPRYQKIGSIKIPGDETGCLELHSQADCGGKFTQLKPGYPELDHLWVWGTSRDAFHAKAISRCGLFCNKTEPESSPIMRDELGPGIVTIFDHQQGHQGYGTTVNITSGCVNLTKSAHSIQTYGQCVLIFREPNCADEQGSYSSGKPAEVVSKKDFIRKIPLVVKSIKLCGPDYKSEEKEDGLLLFVLKVTTMGLALELVIVCICLCGVCAINRGKNKKSSLEQENSI